MLILNNKLNWILTVIYFTSEVLKIATCVDPRCPSAFGLYADLTSCDRYISCWGGRGFSMSCGRNMVFNPETSSCQFGSSCPRIEIGLPSTGEKIRLANSRHQGSGHLLILHSGTWAQVTSANFNDAAASLVCQRLGYKGFSSWFASSSSMRKNDFAILNCPIGSRSIEKCTTRTCHGCSSQQQSVFLRCDVESTSRCPVTSTIWQRWGDSCYLFKDDVKRTREEAKEACQSLDANLLSIDEQMEHEFVSSMLKKKNKITDFYTDGVGIPLAGSGMMWAWQSTGFPLKYQRWWPGWNSTIKLTSPKLSTPLPTPACVLLRKSYPLPLTRILRKSTSSSLLSSLRKSSEYDSGFHFFDVGDCKTSRSFICEAKLVNFGCREGIGSTYAGNANTTTSGSACISWSDPKINNLLGRAAHARAATSTLFNPSLLGNHNFCRNPNNSPRPWCFVGPEKTEDCDIPYCTNQETLLDHDPRITSLSNLLPTIKHPSSAHPSLLKTSPKRKTGNDQSTRSELVSLSNSKPTNVVRSTNEKVRCLGSEYHCDRSDKCIREKQVCDGTRHCPRGDDEVSCKKYLNSLDKSKSTTLIVRDLIQTLYREEVGVCAKRCLNDIRCKAIIYDEQKRECGLSRISIGESGLISSTREDVYEVTIRKYFCGNKFKCANKRCLSKSLACNGKNDCGDNSDEAKCSKPTSHEIRLTGGSAPHKGNIEIRIQNKWGFICDDGFGWNEADVVCKELGFSGAAKFSRNNNFGTNTGSWLRSSPRFWLSNINCSGKEANILECSSNGIGHHGCAPTEIAGVICRRSHDQCEPDQFQCNERRTCIPRTHVCNNIINCPDLSDEEKELCDDFGAVKLVSTKASPSTSMGTVHVKHKGQWGTVCDDYFEEKHAQVVCRSLGFDTEWATPYSKAHFGRGTGGVLIDEPGCKGNEAHLAKCPQHTWSPGNCDHSEDAGVFCSDKEEVRLVGGTKPHEGRVEIMLAGVWGTICDDDFDDYDAKVVCKMLGYRGGGIAHKRGYFGKGTGPVWLHNVDCLGHESTLNQCRRSPPGTSSCSHSEDTGVTCFHSDPSENFDRGLKSKLPGSCGFGSAAPGSFLYDNLAKIVGGRTIQKLDSPWLVSLQLREKGVQKHNCGGVVIAEDLVLTAAHCFRSHGKEAYIVRVGEFDLETHENSQEDFSIEKLYVHDDFDTKVEFNNDFALLKIGRRNGRGIRLGGSIQPVCLPSIDTDYSRVTNCQITGWGTTNEDAEAIPERKPRSGRVQVFPMSRCLGDTGYAVHEITSGMICAGQLDGSVDTCTGDSGGPLTCKVNGQHVLFGITSWGKGCGRRGQPGMYTKVTKYLRWLGSIVP